MTTQGTSTNATPTPSERSVLQLLKRIAAFIVARLTAPREHSYVAIRPS